MIYVSKICGTCPGAKNAIDMAKKLASEGKNVYIYKEILHNNTVIKELEKLGVSCVENLNDVKDGVVVIRAHGEPKSTYDYLNKNNIEYYDATCKNVAKIHEQIEQKFNDGYTIILIGKKGHPEVIGSCGWADSVFVVEDYDDIKKLDISNDKIFVICHTTFNKDKALSLSEEIKNKYSDRKVEFVNSICNVCVNTQMSSIEVAKKCDYMIVIGGKTSSNTKELYNICSKYCDSYLISNVDELFSFLKDKKEISANTNIGITAGSSTMNYEIEEYKNIIEFYIDYKSVLEECKNYQDSYNNELLNEKNNDLVNNAIMELTRMNSDGKFIRAYLISLAYKLFGFKDNKYLPLAISYELFQTAILIHDDIIDNSDKRRGKDTIPVTYRNKYNNILEKNHLANSLAICIGDLGFYLSNKILLDNYSNNKNLNNLLKEYTEIVIKTIKGEIIDVELPIINRYQKSKEHQEDHVMEIYKLKTAWYTLIGPFRLGMILSGNNNSDFDSMLLDLGIAFQIKDDILGIFGNSMEKSITSDISEFKQTILYSYINDYKSEYKQDLLKYYGNINLTEEDVQNVKEIFIKSGALDYAKCKQDELFCKSIEKLDKIDIELRYKNIIKGFISYLKYRNK